jgi:AmpD protein
MTGDRNGSIDAAPLDAGGWLAGVRHCPSPHRDDRPPAVAVELLVLHNISLPPGRYGTGRISELFLGQLPAGADPFLDTVRGMRVSAHLVIARDGTPEQFVSLWQRAWHAGVSCFEGRPRCNDFSVGIELEGTDFEPYTDAQYHALAALAPRLRAALPLRAVRGHCHIAAARKTDPGPSFDWARFGREGGWAQGQLPPGIRAESLPG